MRPSLLRTLAVGTDSESNLGAATLNNLPFAQHVRCAIHMTHDIQEKIKAMGVPKACQSQFLKMLWVHSTLLIQKAWWMQRVMKNSMKYC